MAGVTQDLAGSIPGAPGGAGSYGLVCKILCRPGTVSMSQNATMKRLRVKLQNATTVLQGLISNFESTKDSLVSPTFRNTILFIKPVPSHAPAANQSEMVRGEDGFMSETVSDNMASSPVESSGRRFFL